MPTYQYKREDGSIFEVMQKMSEAPLRICPETGQSVSRVISGGAGVVYKGEGWYITDYKNKKAPANEKSATTEKTAETTPSVATSEKATAKAS